MLIGGLAGNLLLVGIGCSFYFFFIQPTFTSLINTSNELALLEKRKIFLREAAHEIKQRSDDLNALDAAFLHLEDAVPFVTLLETIAAQNNVTISIQADSISNSTATKQAEFNLTITGTLAHVMQFIKQIESLPYFTDISSLTLSTKNTQVEAIINLSVLAL